MRNSQRENKAAQLEQKVQSILTDWPAEKIKDFQGEFLAWYDEEKRPLPWRLNQDPYRIWVSEIMLQQTRVETVIPYFERFMEWFPTIEALANAPEEKVLKAWEGLGYYSRVRNLQAASRQIMDEFAGEMPQTIQDILMLKGIGPYTAGAISSIAFNQVEPAVDGNVMRVISRLLLLSEDIAKPATHKLLAAILYHLLPKERPGDFNQALMDLGSRICRPKQPQCNQCPLARFCQAKAVGQQEILPVKSKKVAAKPVHYLALAIQNEQKEWLFQKRPPTGLLANMWTFPLLEVSSVDYLAYYESFSAKPVSQIELPLVAEEMTISNKLTQAGLPDTIIWQTELVGEATHLFSHLKWQILVAYGFTHEPSLLKVGEDEQWLSITDLQEYPLPKPQQKILDLLNKKGYLS